MDGGESGEVAGAEPVDRCADGDDANDARESVHTHAHDTQWTHAVRETPNQTSACVIELGRGCHAGREESFAVAVCGRCRRAVVIWRCARPSHPRPSRVTCWHGWVDTEGDVVARALWQCVGIGSANAAMVASVRIRMAPVGSADAGARRGGGAGARTRVALCFQIEYRRVIVSRAATRFRSSLCLEAFVSSQSRPRFSKLSVPRGVRFFLAFHTIPKN